ncbi:hypothetical protein KP79_PYT10330 [Mizuhopecten yessoensis]|uniref:Homeobox domain-containing protein n=1 Tax=Mizuhopecten yessoensis TaxID=6573 RepID=A0A210QFC4_MIZYE|nr:hypothetical protein KP79_PYT10330 [Mizuhopecten yessoensis]
MFLAPISHAVDATYTTLATLTACPVTPVTDHVKKPKRIRTSYTETQINEFEKIFVNNQYPSRKLMDKLSNTLDIPVERMRNRRSRQKKVRQSKISKHPLTTAYSHTDTFPEDMDPSFHCLGGTAMAVPSGADEMNHWLYAHTTYTPTTNQACMNCDSRTVYSTLYHHPVMTPGVVRSPR